MIRETGVCIRVIAWETRVAVSFSMRTMLGEREQTTAMTTIEPNNIHLRDGKTFWRSAGMSAWSRRSMCAGI